MTRRFRRRPWRPLLALLVVLVLAARAVHLARQPEPFEALLPGVYHVERVVDGDTLLLANRARVRLQGVDTPESVKPDHPVEPWGPEASAFTREFVAGGRVRLEFDRERKDVHDRFLAYVWVDDRMLNEALLRAGLATAETGYRFSETMKRRFRQAEAEAKQAHRGIWSSGSDER